MARTPELRVEQVEFDDTARSVIRDDLALGGALNLVANKRAVGDRTEYADKELEQRGMNPVPRAADLLFPQIAVVNPSSFSETLHVRGIDVDGYRVLRADSPAAPNAIAAILLALRDATGGRPQAYFEWSEGSPIGHLLRCLLLGQGDTAPEVREILRENESDPARRPGIHLGGS